MADLSSPQQQPQAQRFNFTNETKLAMTEAKATAQSFAKHLADTASAYDSGCRGAGASNNSTMDKARKLIPTIEANSGFVADCTMLIEGSLRHSTNGPEAKRALNQLDRHHKEQMPRQGALVRRCYQQLSEALGKAKLHASPEAGRTDAVAVE